MAQLLQAQEGKYAEVADAARRKTAETLQAEVDRNDAARQNACGASLLAAPPRPMPCVILVLKLCRGAWTRVT